MATSAPPLEQIRWGVCPLPAERDPDLEREARDRLGFVPPYLRYLAPCPWLARASLRDFRNRGLACLDIRTAELVFLTVSRDNSCRYCYASQRLLLRVAGLDAEDLRRLEENAYAAQHDPRQRLALDFSRRVSRANPSPGPADRAALARAGWSDDEIRELAWVAAYSAEANRISTLGAFPLEPLERNERWYMRPLWPLIRRALRSHQQPGARTPLAPEEKQVPFAFLVEKLDGLPAGHALSEQLAAAWRSTILPRRAKALVFGVVARGLGCQRSEDEARRLLAEGGLPGDDVDAVLDHLTGPGLDALEARIVPFVRDSIWYRPEEIQRKARGLFDDLGHVPFLELVGVVSLANKTCRLSKALDGGE